MAGPPTPPPSGRADARRNHDAVIAAALDVLAQRPDAGMREVADASGLTRTTVYRHFPSRDALLRAIFRKVREDGEALVAEVTAADPPAAQALPAIARVSIALGERYRFLSGHHAIATDVWAELDRGVAEDNPSLRYIRVAQARGELRADLPAEWQYRMLLSLAAGAYDEVLAGRVDAEQAARLLGATLLGAFGADAG